ncbi:MAG: Nudix family hydrolase [Pseudomonadota bacterium]
MLSIGADVCMAADDDFASYVHVVAAAIINQDCQVLITRRPLDVHQGGTWEFPGGKVEWGEQPLEALRRELEEELDVTPLVSRPLIKFRYEYPDKRVLLDIWQVDRFHGRPVGREGQALKWVVQSKLKDFRFPEANLPILAALRLPKQYLITPDPGEDWQGFLVILRKALRNGCGLIRFRAYTLSDEDYCRCAKEVIQLCRDYSAYVLIDRRIDWVEMLGADGIHLNSRSLMESQQRPLPLTQLVAASCHNLEELLQANRIGSDLAVVSPVKATRSHPGRDGLGWQEFAALCDSAVMPVYALGGMRPADMDRVWHHGGQGIAAIRSLWPA